MKVDIRIRITLVGPPAAVQYAVQKGKDEIVSVVRADGSDLTFDVGLTCSGQLESGAPRFTGPFAQGPAHERFVYLTIGTMSGDRTSPWSRRAKIHISAITIAMIEEAQSRPDSVIAGRFTGSDKYGGPTCASLRPIGEGWKVVGSINDSGSEALHQASA